MANTINIPKSHLILGLSLPLAVLIGYFLAEPMELSSVAVVVAVLGTLCIPLMLRWHYLVLVLCWNAALNPVVLPGRASMWALMAFVSLLFAILARAVNPKSQFIVVPSIIRPLLVLAAVVIVTGLLTGGFGVRSLGSARFGGKRYFYLLAAIAGFFALTSRRIPPGRSSLYVAAFFLSTMTYAVANLVLAAGPRFHFLLGIFSPDFAQDQIASFGRLESGMVRVGGLGVMASGVCAYLMARYGIAGLLDLTRPWRILLFLVVACAGLMGGFRSYLAQLVLTFTALFIVEGLHRTRYLPILLGVVLLGGAVVLPQAERLPLVVQRTLSFLPGNFHPLAERSAMASTEWRWEMWKQVWPEVPKHLFRGKGFAIDPGEMFLALDTSLRFRGEEHAGTVLVGDYHNGPLSILIPLGIYGMIAFLWFLAAGVRVLHRNWKHGNPEYRNINAFLLAAFAAHAVFFFLGFGSISDDLHAFVGLLGLGIALNGAESALRERAEQPAGELELNTEYIKA